MRLLSLEDDPGFAALLRAAIEAEGLACELERVECEEDFLQALHEGGLDLILADYSLPQYDGFSALRAAHQHAPDVPFIFVSGFLGEDVAIESLRNGATDYVLKANLSRLVPAIRRALAEAAERRQNHAVQQALQESQDRFRLITEQSSELIAELSADGNIVYASPNHLRVLGYSPDEITGRPALELVDPADRESVREALQSQRDSLVLTYRARHKQGTTRWLESSGQTFLTAARESRIVVVSRDVTTRRLNDCKLRQQAALLDLAQDTITVLDLEGRITFWNRGAEITFGWTAAEAAGTRFADLAGLEPATLAAIRDAVVRREFWEGELAAHNRRRDALTLNARWTLVRDDAGVPHALFLIGTDITERKRLESQFLRAQRLESVGILASGIAHDLNNVLTPIAMSIQMFRDKLKEPQDQELLKNLETSTRRGADIIRQVLAFTRGTEGPLEPLEIHRLIKEIARIVGETFPRSIQLESRTPRGLWMVRGNPTQLYQVLMNLCVNARDAMTAGGRLTLEAENCTLDDTTACGLVEARAGDYVRLTVADTGSGMTSEVQEHMFDPFFSTKEPGKGTGLGLATVLKIVTHHRGFLHVQSAPGRGTCIHVYLPAQKLTRQDPAGAGETNPLMQGHGELILVVDDEAAICRFALKALHKAGYRCLCAGNGQEAMELFQQHREEIRLVITDLMMPVMGGDLVIRAIMQQRPDMRFIAMSGLLEQEVVAGLPKERVLSLAKPFESEQLLAAVAHSLAPAGQGSPTPHSP